MSSKVCGSSSETQKGPPSRSARARLENRGWAMDCQSVMRVTKTCLYEDAKAGTAIDFMVERHMGLVPVVDRDEKFVGLLSGDRLMHFMLPRILTVVRGLKQASYLRESKEELRERLEELRERHIGELLDRDVKTARPDTPLVDALMLLSNKQYVVPVVTEKGQLMGAISFFSILHALEDSAPTQDHPPAEIEKPAQK